MPKRTKAEEYEICMERGHKYGESKHIKDQFWTVCEKCGTKYRTKRIMLELQGGKEVDMGEEK